jgi:hypothetical protein
MSQPTSHVVRTRAAITRLTDAFEGVTSCLREYESLGGADGVLPHWQTRDAEGHVVDRTDLDVTHPQYVDAIASIQAIQGLVAQGHSTNLYRVKG